MKPILAFFGGRLRLLVDVVLIAALIYAGWRLVQKPAPIAISSPAPGVTTIEVPTPVISTKTITQTIQDPAARADADALLKQNADLKARVAALVSAQAVDVSHGGGAVQAIENTNQTGSTFTFDDHRLRFRLDVSCDWVAGCSSGPVAYTLTQHFAIVSTTGRQKDGKPLALAQLFEIMPDGSHVPIQTVQTTAIFADETAPHWMTGLSIQAGLAASLGSGAAQPSAIVDLAWLTHGRTRAVNDLDFSIGSPAVLLARGLVDVGIEPIAVNVGKPLPLFSNLWIGPYLSRHRIGVAVAATF